MHIMPSTFKGLTIPHKCYTLNVMYVTRFGKAHQNYYFHQIVLCTNGTRPLHFRDALRFVCTCSTVTLEKLCSKCVAKHASKVSLYYVYVNLHGGAVQTNETSQRLDAKTLYV